MVQCDELHRSELCSLHIFGNSWAISPKEPTDCPMRCAHRPKRFHSFWVPGWINSNHGPGSIGSMRLNGVLVQGPGRMRLCFTNS